MRKIWDPCTNSQVVSFGPQESDKILPECWAVAFGNAFSLEDWNVAVGYDNGDIKMFDLKMNLQRWETNLKNGISHLELDRKDIPMKKLSATTLESIVHIFDIILFILI